MEVSNSLFSEWISERADSLRVPVVTRGSFHRLSPRHPYRRAPPTLLVARRSQKYWISTCSSPSIWTVVVLSLTACLVLNLSVYIINEVGDDKFLEPFYFFWPGWTITHTDWESGTLVELFLLRYPEVINPVYCVCFFVIYGLTENARQQHRTILWAIVKPFGIRPKPSESKTLSSIAFNPTPVMGSYV